jgi:hypothetical protein
MDIVISKSGFVFDPEGGNFFFTNQIGMEIIKMLKEGIEINKIRASVKDKYLIDDISFEKDFNSLINILNKNNLIES